MPEGLSASEVGKEIAEHAKHAGQHERRDRLISIAEAVLLSVVALLAACRCLRPESRLRQCSGMTP